MLFLHSREEEFLQPVPIRKVLRVVIGKMQLY